MAKKGHNMKKILFWLACTICFYSANTMAMAKGLYEQACSRKNYIETAEEQKDYKLIKSILQGISAKSSNEEKDRAIGRIIGVMNKYAQRESELEARRFLGEIQGEYRNLNPKFGSDDYERESLLKVVNYHGLSDKCTKQIKQILDAEVTDKAVTKALSEGTGLIVDTGTKVIKALTLCTLNKIDQVMILNMMKNDLTWKSHQEGTLMKEKALLDTKITILNYAISNL